MATNIAKTGSYTEFTSLSQAMKLIPVRTNVAFDLGLYSAEYLNTDTVMIPRVTISDSALVDITWGQRVKNAVADGKSFLTLAVPHFAGEDAILPRDVRGKFDWEDLVSASRPETVQRFVARKMEKAKQTIANTWAKGAMHVINNGTAYAPNGTISTNYFTEFGVTQTSLPIALNDDLTDPKPAIKAIIRDIQDNFKGGYIPNRFVGLCDRAFFDKLERHAYVVDAMKFTVGADFQSIDILTKRLGTQGYNLSAQYEVLDFGGVIWICCAAGEITANEARVFPTDVPDLFKMFFAPSEENFDIVNSEALDAYYFEYMSERRDRVDIHFETNVLFAVLWPKALVRVTITP